MMLDIAALQSMYGFTSAHTTDTTYRLTNAESADLDMGEEDGSITIGRAYFAIWDRLVNSFDNGLADLNGGGAVDGKDSFDSLLIWRDINGDAVWGAFGAPLLFVIGVAVRQVKSGVARI